MSTTDLDISALVHLAYRIREDAHGCKPWDREGTHHVFTHELKGMHLPTAVEIVVRHAADPEAKTPGAIKRPFLPEASKPKTIGPMPPTKAEECPDHVGQYPPPNCAIHAQEPVKAYWDEPVDRVPEATARDIARKAAAEAASHLKETTAR